MHSADNNSGTSLSRPSDRRSKRVALRSSLGAWCLGSLSLIACAKGHNEWAPEGRPPAERGPSGSETPGKNGEDPAAAAPNAMSTSNCATIDTGYTPRIDPARFVGKVDNPLFPLVPGTTFTYSGEKRNIETTVTPNTRDILGVKTIEVHDVVTEGGKVVTDALRWYAQDKAGDVWYFGAEAKALDGVRVTSTDGSWESGKDGAQPGLIVPAKATVGQEWRRGYHPCFMEDQVKVLAIDANVNTSGKSFTKCLQTAESTVLDPSVKREKYYCPDNGLVLYADQVTGQREGLNEVQGPPTTPPANPFPPAPRPPAFLDAGLPQMPPMPAMP